MDLKISQLGAAGAVTAGSDLIEIVQSGVNKKITVSALISGGGGGMAIGNAVISATAGSVFFAGTSGVLAQDNTNFFWNNTSKSLTIGTDLSLGTASSAGSHTISSINSTSNAQLLIQTQAVMTFNAENFSISAYPTSTRQYDVNMIFARFFLEGTAGRSTFTNYGQTTSQLASFQRSADGAGSGGIMEVYDNVGTGSADKIFKIRDTGGDIFSITGTGNTVNKGTFTIGGLTITSGSVLLDLQSTSLAVLMPRVTNIASVTTPVNGMIAYDAATGKFNFRQGGSWVLYGTGGGDMLLGTAQTVTASKTFQSGTLIINDTTNAFTYTFQAATPGGNRTINIPAFVSTTEAVLLQGFTQPITGPKTFSDQALLINNPAGTFAYTIRSAAIAAARDLNLPLTTGTDTLGALGMTQTWTGANTFNNASVLAGAATMALFNTTATTITFAGAATTLTVGGTPNTAVTHNYSTNATATATTKAINFGTGGASGSTTNITIGSTTSGALGTITTRGILVYNQSSQATSNTFITYNQAAHTGGITTGFIYHGGAHTGLTASNEILDFWIDLGRTVQLATGTVALMRSAVITAPTYAFVGASSITVAATLALTYMTGGTNATIASSSALLIQTTTVANTTNAYGINISAPTGATNNFAALFTGRVDIDGGVALKTTVVTSITASQNDYAIGAKSYFQLTSNASYNITGLTGGYDGKIIVINNTNTSAFSFTFTNEDASSTAANRVHCSTGANITVAKDGSITLIYDITINRWRDLAVR